MLTIEKIKTDFEHIRALTGNAETYHGTEQFIDHGEFCDIYFQTVDKKLNQKQIDIYNNFRNHYKNYLPYIERTISEILDPSGHNLTDNIRKEKLFFDVIEITQNISSYDMVLVCSITTRIFLFLKRNISFRIEFKNGEIKSLERKRNTTSENQIK